DTGLVTRGVKHAGRFLAQCGPRAAGHAVWREIEGSGLGSQAPASPAARISPHPLLQAPAGGGGRASPAAFRRGDADLASFGAAVAGRCPGRSPQGEGTTGSGALVGRAGVVLTRASRRHDWSAQVPDRLDSPVYGCYP